MKRQAGRNRLAAIDLIVKPALTRGGGCSMASVIGSIRTGAFEIGGRAAVPASRVARTSSIVWWLRVPMAGERFRPGSGRRSSGSAAYAARTSPRMSSMRASQGGAWCSSHIAIGGARRSTEIGTRHRLYREREESPSRPAHSTCDRGQSSDARLSVP